MRLLSWNINGIRAISRKGFQNFLESTDFDVLFLQEIKIAHKDIEKENLGFPGFKVYWNPATRPGYSGTAALVPENGTLPEKVWTWQEDEEGRAQFLEFPDLYAVNVYFPNAGANLERLNFKIDFNNELEKKLQDLGKKKPVAIGGDFNVAHQEIDIARPRDNEGKAGFTQEEREWMTKFIDNGYYDTFRYFYPDTVKYSWWSYRGQARPRNVGWRLDYFCIDDNLKKRIKDSFIWDTIQGSDHCPVGVDL